MSYMYTDEETAANRGKWTEALRSGRYPQIRKQLRGRLDNGDTGYCCLGVACEVAIAEGLDLVQLSEYGDGSYSYLRDGDGWVDETDEELPPPVADWLGITKSGLLRVEESYEREDGAGIKQVNCLIHLNDDEQCSFGQIADVIDAGKVLLRAGDAS